MTDEQQAQAQDAQDGGTTDEKMFPQSYVKEVREEAKQYRLEKQATEQRLQELEAKLASQETEKLKEQQRYAELYQQEKERAEQLAQETKAMQLQVQKAQVAAQYNLPAELADRLKGSNMDELTADAEQLAQLIPQAQRRTGTASVPQGDTSTAPTDKELAAKFLYGHRNRTNKNNVDTDGKTYWYYSSD
jgi:vacuolar-type H+-ATPase subunit I/STV1